MPFENDIQKAPDFKSQKYKHIVSDILDNGITYDVTSLEIGLPGFVTPENIGIIEKNIFC